MAQNSGIEWTDSTWNPIVACSIVSPGCTNCYAMRLAGTRLKGTAKYQGLTKPTKAGPVWTGEVRLWEKALLDPLRWRAPRMIFVNSEGDLFHESITDEWIDHIFAVMAMAPQHTFQVLTKRARRMREYITLGKSPHDSERRSARIIDAIADIAHANPKLRSGASWPGWPLPNVWLGVSAERQQEFDERWPDLQATPATVRFVSAEPLLAPIRIGDARPSWLIVGGESASQPRHIDLQWARSLRDECAAAGVAFFFKQTTNKEPIPDDLLVRQFPTPSIATRVAA